MGEAVYLFDVGSGVERQMAAAGLRAGQIRAVFISHHHIDHNAGLGPLVVNRWVLDTEARPLPILGPPGTDHMVRSLVSAFKPTERAPIAIGGPLPSPIRRSVRSRDLPDRILAPIEIYADEHVRVLAVLNSHFEADQSAAAKTARSYSFRVVARGRSIVYTGDTGPSRAVEQLASGADLLVSEVIDVPATVAVIRSLNLPDAKLRGIVSHLEAHHLTPEEVGKLAAASGTKEVVLTHLAPGADVEIDTLQYSSGIERHFRGRTRVAKDLDRF